MPQGNCLCLNPTARYTVFTATELGIDKARGRYGDVALLECRHCGAKWLRYHVEYEAFSGSGRWYRGLISEAQAQRITAAEACKALEQLDWYFYGGPYFGTAGRRGAGPVRVDL